MGHCRNHTAKVLMTNTLTVLHEDNHLLVVAKPCGLATAGVPSSETSLVKIAKDYIKRKYHKPGNVYLGVVSRLDSSVSGIVVLARTSKSASRLAEQFRTGRVAKRYWAIVSGRVAPDRGTLVDRLFKDERALRMRVASAGSPPQSGERRAELSYRVLGRDRGDTLLEVELITGRKHQIRAQLSARGWPILGDKKYGSRRRFCPGIALHSAMLRLSHPSRKIPMTFRSPPASDWKVGRFQVDFETHDFNLRSE